MRVLIIDDSALMRRIVGGALRDAGLKIEDVVEAGNGAEGLAALTRLAEQGRQPDIILCDVHMPQMNGAEFLRACAAVGLNVAPVLMVTADASDPMVAEALANGASGFIAKPFSAEQIRAQVAVVMEHA